MHSKATCVWGWSLQRELLTNFLGEESSRAAAAAASNVGLNWKSTCNSLMKIYLDIPTYLLPSEFIHCFKFPNLGMKYRLISRMDRHLWPCKVAWSWTKDMQMHQSLVLVHFRVKAVSYLLRQLWLTQLILLLKL